MLDRVFTHALWRVRPGQEQAFVADWTALADVFARLDRPPFWGTLLQSASDPHVFYSFGPWPSAEAVAEMRRDEAAAAAMARLRGHCEEATPGLYREVKHVEVRADGPGGHSGAG